MCAAVNAECLCKRAVRSLYYTLTSKQVLHMVKINFFSILTSFSVINKKEKALEKCKKYLKMGLPDYSVTSKCWQTPKSLWTPQENTIFLNF